MKVFITVFLFILITGHVNAQKNNLALKLKNGNTYYMNGSSISEVLETVNGQQIKVKIGTDYKISFKVLGLQNKLYNMDVRYQSIQMKINTGAGETTMDSRSNNKQDVASAIIAGMIDKPFTTVMSASGKIISIKGVEDIIEKAINGSVKMDGIRKAAVRSQLLQNFNGNALKNNLEMATAIYPESAVSQSDKWLVTTQTGSAFKATIRTTYQLENNNAAFYKLHGEGIIITDKDTNTGQMNGMPMKYDLTGTIRTDIQVDKNTGWPTKVKSNQTMNGKVQILDNPKIPGGVVFPIVLNNNTLSTGS